MEKLVIPLLKRQKMRGSILLSLAIIVFLACTSFLFSHPTFAEGSESIVETTFFGNVQDDGKGCGVFMILNLVVDILAGGVGIVGIIGISVAGIQYLTAGGNEQQTIKAKRRIVEVVIGLVALAVLYTAMQWLLPGGKLSTNNTCATVSDEELAKIKAEENKNQNTTNKSNSKNSSSPLTAKLANGKTITISNNIAKIYTAKQLARKINKGKVAPPSKVCTDCTWSERIAQTAEYLSWPESESPSTYTYDNGGTANKPFREALDAVDPKHGSSFWDLGADCGKFVGVVIRYSGYDPHSMFKCQGYEDFYANKPKLWKEIPASQAKRGDVCIRGGCHTLIVLGHNKVAEAHHGQGGQFGHIASGTCSSTEFEWNGVLYKPKAYRAVPR